jgi:hypothetical protein
MGTYAEKYVEQVGDLADKSRVLRKKLF